MCLGAYNYDLLERVFAEERERERQQNLDEWNRKTQPKPAQADPAHLFYLVA